MNFFKIIISLTFLNFGNFNGFTVSAFLINTKYINNQNSKYISRNNLFEIQSNEGKESNERKESNKNNKNKENKFQDIHKSIKSMSFNLNKDSLWISYPLKTSSFSLLSKSIPKNQRLVKCKIFEEDDLDYRLFFNIFEVKTPFFSGNRFEIVTITKNIKNNKLSFVILDCFTNVMTWDPLEGIQKANCKIKKKITNSKYNIKITNMNGDSIFNLTSLKTKLRKQTLSSFCIDPNHECYFKTHDKSYKLIFNEKQINKKVQFLRNVDIQHNKENLKYLNSIYSKDLEHIFIFPNEMNFKVKLH